MTVLLSLSGAYKLTFDMFILKCNKYAPCPKRWKDRTLKSEGNWVWKRGEKVKKKKTRLTFPNVSSTGVAREGDMSLVMSPPSAPLFSLFFCPRGRSYMQRQIYDTLSFTVSQFISQFINSFVTSREINFKECRYTAISLWFWMHQFFSYNSK